MLRKLRSLAQNIFRRKKVETDLDSEIHGYLDQLRDEKIASGMSPEEAERAARLELGGLDQVKEQVRDARSGATLETLFQDIQYGWRVLRNNLAFSAVAVLTLALGIGANTAIFSIVYGVLLQPLPYESSEQLIRISTNWTGATDGGVSGAEYFDYKSQATVFEDVALHSSIGTMNIAFGSGEPERAPRVLDTSSFFEVLKTRAAIGRTFLPQEDAPGNNHVLVISYGLWQRRFGGDRSAVGKVVNVGGIPYTIVGVMPQGFQFPTKEINVWRPLGLNPAKLIRGAHNLRMIARCKPGVTVQRAQGDLDLVASRLREKYPVDYPQGSGFSPRVYSLREYMVGSLRTPLFVLFAAVGFVLLIACVNVSNLILARAGARQKELAIRAALGAGRKRLVRQALTESILLSSLGGVLAIALAYAALRLLVRLSLENIPRLDEVAIHSGVLIFTMIISLLTGIGVGFAAAWHFYRAQPNEALKQGGRSASDAAPQKFRSALVVFEVALAAALLLSAVLLVRGFLKLENVPPGLQSQGVFSATISLLDVRYQESAKQFQFFDQLIEAISNRNSVESASAIDNPPFSGWYNDTTFEIEGRALPAPGLYPDEEIRIAASAYFRTLGIPILRGREFERTDRADSFPVAVVSDSLSRKFWPNESPIGKRVKIAGLDPESPWMTIVGVVGDVRHGGLSDETRPILYLPMAQNPNDTMTIVIHSRENPAAISTALREAVRNMDPSLPLYNVRTMEEAVSESLAQPRFTFRLISFFAALALVLASIGIYGTLAYSVIQRTREIGVRLALGASRTDILGMVCKYGLTLATIGLVAGVACGAAISRVLTSLLFGLSPFDPGTYLTVALLILVVSLTAVMIPAFRATRVNPLSVLHYE